MIDYLFKLKKDGKTVGYLMLMGAEARYGFDSDECVYTHNIFEMQLCKEYQDSYQSFLSVLIAHPFVTKDKNGKDVFAGDKVKTVIPDVSSDSLVGTIVQNDNPLACWMFKYRFDEEDFGEKEHLAPAPDLQNIELIEDKDNE